MGLAQFIGVAKLLIIMLVVVGGNPFQYINQPTPSWWDWFVENKTHPSLSFHSKRF